MIEIMNLRRDTMQLPWDFRVDLRSPVGNPFTIGGLQNRDQVCDMYKKYFDQESGSPLFRVYLDNMLVAYKMYGELRLFCWCAPKRCHSETIKGWLENEV